MTLINFWITHRADMSGAVAQHLLLTLVATIAAIVIGVPLGIVAARRPRLGAVLLAVANVAQTVPSLAMFGFLVALPLIGGVGARSALLVLILYALLPVMRNTVTGIQGIDRAARDAGVALGMTPQQLLVQVELPLAMPTMVAGVRVAAVVGVGAATIAAAIGAGGLGDYIFRGLSMTEPTLILAGAVPAALLALAVDASLGWLERAMTPGAARSGRVTVRAATTAGVALVLIVMGSFVVSGRWGDRIVVGSKNFSEQVILGELLAQTIERTTDLRVERRLNLGGTFIADQALQSGAIDAYVEYTGTALTGIFHQQVSRGHADVLARVIAAYAASGRTVLAPLGFNNTFAILIRGAEARRLNINTISEAAPYTPGWKAAFGYEFLEREDGYKGLVRTYGLRFAETPHVMDLTLSYRALAGGSVDLIAGEATSGLIKGLDLFMLKDDRQYFPPYDAIPVVRTQTLMAHPELRTAIERLTGRISEEAMRQMNYDVDVGHRDVALVAREFLDKLLEVR
ncbi:MAG: glycine/betaine ABC transporter substrate-binding protein [Candidatus Methylomirabilota bacterium]|nr:MAG: glycine/betaine ABC transporter substrate-binding protein [candidate division NC10 bacterium]